MSSTRPVHESSTQSLRTETPSAVVHSLCTVALTMASAAAGAAFAAGAANTSGAGALFIALRDSHALMLVGGNGGASLLAGRPGLAGFLDGVGSAALMNLPSALAAGPTGSA